MEDHPPSNLSTVKLQVAYSHIAQTSLPYSNAAYGYVPARACYFTEIFDSEK